MTYPETIQYLDSFVNYEKFTDYPYKESVKLERVKNFLEAINNPQDNLKCLHIAGTKGKGSTCAFIAYILRHAGYSVGLYTSPHLSDFRERIRVLKPPIRQSAKPPAKEDFEGMISEDALSTITERLKPEIEKYNQGSEYGPLSFFEVYTSLAFVYFKEENVDFVVLETGLGGRLDATNAVNSLVSVITPISYEHTQKLGNTLREIAAEKAGIIKGHQVPAAGGSAFGGTMSPGHQPIVISAPQEEEAALVIRNRCRETGVKLYEVGKGIVYEKTGKGFSVKGFSGEYPDLKTGLLGEHQLTNAAVAVGAIEALRLHNIDVSADAIREGLYNTLWPGRCEVVSTNPMTILDGAQNIASMRALKETVKEGFFAKGQRHRRLILILGISSDKDAKGMCGEIYDLADVVILTRADNPRAINPESLVEYFNGKEMHITQGIKEAKEIARRIAGKEDLILACGSLFVVGEARELFLSKIKDDGE